MRGTDYRRIQGLTTHPLRGEEFGTALLRRGAEKQKAVYAGRHFRDDRILDYDGQEQRLYLSKHDVELIKGKKVGIIDDVVSTGASLAGLEALVKKAGGILVKKAFVLAEGDAAKRDDVIYLNTIPVL